MPPRALRPTGLVLVDKPAGPSSFAIVKRLRDRTGARAGPCGDARPLRDRAPARAARLRDAARAVPRRARQALRDRCRSPSTTATGDVEGDPVEEHEPPTLEELQHRLEPFSGDVTLRVPAASAVKIDGRARVQALSRGRGRRDAVPHVDDPRACASSATRTAWRRSSCSSPRARTCARSPMRSAGTAARSAAPPSGRSPWTTPTKSGSCRRPTRCRSCRPSISRRRGRRDTDGPATNRAAGSRDVRRPARRGRRDRVAVKVARDPAELDPRQRAVAIGVFDGVHLGHQRCSSRCRHRASPPR